jgi:hypothetical protein
LLSNHRKGVIFCAGACAGWVDMISISFVLLAFYT